MNRKPIQQWTTKSRKVVFDQRPWVIIEHHEVELPNGRIIPDWPWIITSDYINVVPLTVDHRVLCFRQTKYASQAEALALVGGYINPGEQPEAAAKRELLEETGHEAPNWQFLGHYHCDANRGCGAGYLYLALDARPTAPIRSDDLEQQQLITLTIPELAQAVEQGDFPIMPWTAAAALALLRIMRLGL